MHISIVAGGQLKLWDANTGELIFKVDRKTFFFQKCMLDSEAENSRISIESGSPVKDVSFPKLMHKVNTDFSHSTSVHGNSPTTITDFDKCYHYFYSNHNYEEKVKRKDEDRKNSATDIVKYNSKDFLRTTNNRDSSYLDFSDSSEPISVKRQSGDCDKFSDCGLSQIWCIDYLDNLVVAGCADGRLEFWEVNTNKLKVRNF